MALSTQEMAALEEEFSGIKRRAEAGDGQAQYEMGMIYLRAEGYERFWDEEFVRQHPDKRTADDWFAMSAHSGCLDGMAMHGNRLFWGGRNSDFLDAEMWMLKAARLGSKNAEDDLVDAAYYIMGGLPEELGDESEVREQIKLVEADQEALEEDNIYVGILYEIGRGGYPRDPAKALGYYRKALPYAPKARLFIDGLEAPRAASK